MLIHSAGLQTSIQDLGREQMMHKGIGASGAMDPISMQIANSLLGNPLTHPVIEVTQLGPIIEFEQDISIAICGAEFELFINDQPQALFSTIDVSTGDKLYFGKLKTGARAYLAFAAELDMEPRFNSYSTHLTANFGGYHGRALAKGDRIPLIDPRQVEQRYLLTEQQVKFSGNYRIRCCPSIETTSFPTALIEKLCYNQYQVSSDSNRMGIRLQGRALHVAEPIEFTSSGLLPGSIQLPPSGLPIIAGVDAQTVGGYPRLANVISVDLPILGQLKTKDKISWEMVSVEQALTYAKNKQRILQGILKQIVYA